MVKGNGTVTLAVDGKSYVFNFSTDTSTTVWETDKDANTVRDFTPKTKYTVTVSASSTISDYEVYTYLAKPTKQEDMDRVPTNFPNLNGAWVDRIAKSQISGGQFVLYFYPMAPLRFGEIDEESLEKAITGVTFGLDSTVSGCGTVSGGGFTPGPNTIWTYSTANRKQIEVPAGLADITISGSTSTLRFYRSGQYGVKSGGFYSSVNPVNAMSEYTFTATSYGYSNQPSPLPASPGPYYGTYQSGIVREITRKIGTRQDTYNIERHEYKKLLQTYSYTPWGPYGPTVWGEIWAFEEATTIKPWRPTGTAPDSFVVIVASRTRQLEDNGYTKDLWSTNRREQTIYDGPTTSSPILDYTKTEFWDNDRYSTRPRSILRGVGSDQHEVYHSNPTTELVTYNYGMTTSFYTGSSVSNEFGGGTTYETYRLPKGFDSGNMTTSDPQSQIGKTYKETRTYGDGGSQSLETTYKYVEIADGRTLPSELVTRSGTTVVGKKTLSYALGTFNGYDSITTTANAYSNASNYLTTVSKSYGPRLLNADLRDRPISITRPDGTKTSYAYQRGTLSSMGIWTASATGNHLRVVTVNGKSGSAVTQFKSDISDPYAVTIDALDMEVKNVSGWLVGRSTASVSILDELGNQLFSGSYVYAANVFNLVSHTYQDYNGLGQLVKKYDRLGSAATGPINRVFYDAVYIDGRLDLETDSQGVVVKYDYDSFGRLQKKTAGYGGPGPVETSYVYDRAGRVVQETVGTGTDAVTTSVDYDTAGRQTNVINGAGVVTTFAYDPASNTVTSTESPNGGVYTTITTRFKDGDIKSVTGTAVPDRTYAKSVLSDGRLLTTETFSTGKWTSRATDWLGRQDYVREPTYDGGSRYVYNYYNSFGQLYKQDTKNDSGVHLSPSRLLTYDAYGRFSYEGFDSDMDGALDHDTDTGVVRHFRISRSKRLATFGSSTRSFSTTYSTTASPTTTSRRSTPS